MPAYQKFNSFIAAAHNKVHNLSTDTLKVALSNTLPDAGDTVLADITEIAYTNLSSRTLTTTSSTQLAGLYKLILADLLLTASGGAVATWQYIIIYNDTATSDELICWADVGTPITMTDGSTFNIDNHATNGVLQNT